MQSTFAESTVEEAVLEWAEGLEYAILHGPEIAPGEPAAERETFGDVVLVQRLADAIETLMLTAVESGGGGRPKMVALGG